MKKITTLLFLLALVCVKGWGQVANYIFNPPTTATYVSQVSGATVISGTPWDDNVFTTTVPFAFTFSGITYSSGSTVYVNSNGSIAFTQPSSPDKYPISNGDDYTISAMGVDLFQKTTTNATFTATWSKGSNILQLNSGSTPLVGTVITSPSSISGLTVINVSSNTITLNGNAGAKGSSTSVTYSTSEIVTNTVGNKFYIEWVNSDLYNDQGSNLNFQIVLNSNNTININYGSMSVSNNSSTTADVGLTGATDYLALYNSWSSPLTSTTNNSKTQSLSSTIYPTSGLTYTFAPPPALSASPTTLNFGSSCLNTSPAVQSTTVTGTNLTTANVTVGPFTGYTFSTDATNYLASVSLSHAAGSYSQLIYIKFTPTTSASYNGNVPVGGGGASSISVAVTGTGVNTAPTATSGTAGSVTYNSATVGGTLTAGCSNITAYGIEYSTSANSLGINGGSTATKVAGGTLSSGNFTSALTALTPNTTYYYDAYATGGGTTVYGAQSNFTTALAPCTTPNPSAGVTTGQTTITSIPVSIAAPASTIPTGYLIVTSTSSTLSSGPVNGNSTYASGSSLGGGIVQGTVAYGGAITSFTASSSLSSNTKYYVFVYSYNSGCSGAPYYSTVTSTNATTIPSAPTIGLATAGNASASVAFTGPSGSANITGYTVTSNPAGGTGSGTSPVTVNGLTNGTSYTFTVTATNAGGTSAASAASNSVTPLAPAPTLSATTNPTSVDNSFTITYPTNAAYKTAINSGNIQIATSGGGTPITLTSTDYTVSADNKTITFTPTTNGNTLLHTPGTYTITVNAYGYTAATVTQTLTAGAAKKLAMGTQPTNPSTNGGTVGTPTVKITDQYGNATTSTASVTATVGLGSWTIGGTPTATASGGTATFNNITATTSSPNTVTATITFTSGTLISVTSNSFVIPGATITTSVNGTTFCAGANITVSFTSAGTFTANNAYTAVLSTASGSFGTGAITLGTLNSTANSGSITAAIPTSASGTGYRVRVTSSNPSVTGSDNGSDLTINTPPTALSVTPATATICANSSQLLTVTGGTTINAIAFSENFDNTTSNNPLPSGWVRSAIFYGFPHFPYPTTFPPFYSTAESVANYNTWSPPGAGYGGNGECLYFYSSGMYPYDYGYLYTPSLDLSSYSSATLTFYMFNSGGDDYLDVYAAQGNGSYTKLNSSSYGATNDFNWKKITIDVSSFVGSGFNAVKIRFKGTADNGGSNIAIDNVVVSGTAQAPITWSPVTNLSPTNGASVTATPTATTTYTATATDPITGCTATGTSTLTVTPLSTASFTASTFTTCTNQNVQLAITGTPSTSVGYQINNSGSYATPLDGSGKGNIQTNNLQTGSNTYTLKTVTASGTNTCAANISSTATVNGQALPTVSAITIQSGGGAYVQTGTSTLQLKDATTGGTWSTSDATIATLNGSSPVTVTGVAAGTPTITYTVTDGTTLHCQNTATQVVRVYNPDYVNVTASHNFSDNSNWQINRGDGTYIAAPSAPSTTNQSYTSITLTTPLNMDVDFTLPNGKTFTITGSGTMTILPNKTFSSAVGSTVDFGGKSVTVKSVGPTSTSPSTAVATGAIGQMLGTFTGASNVTAERYIGSTAFSAGRRAWRLVTAPVTGVTINQAWQEGGVSSTGTPNDPNHGYGTLITGFGQGSAANAANNGFDYWSSIAGNTTSSIRSYVPNSTGGTWASYSTIAGLTINSQRAYMLFVRGDRSAWNASSTSANLNTKGITTLRATGTLNKGTQTFSVAAGNSAAYTLVGNPFASTIDFDKVLSASNGILPQFSFWNSQYGSYGAYALVQKSGSSYIITPSGFTGGSSASPQYIASGEGFFVQPSSATTAGSVVIGESAKVSASAAVINPYRLTPDTDEKLYVNLNLLNSDSTATLADGVMERFDASYSAAIDEDDALKQTNFNENLSIESGGTAPPTELIVEARPLAQKTDTVQLRLWNVSARPYQLQLKGGNFAASLAQGLHAYLEDSYLKSREEVSLTGGITTVNFTVTGDASSYDPHRFRIVFQSEAAVLPVTLTRIKAEKANGGVAVSWTTENETGVKGYTVERSVDEGASFAALAEEAAKNASGVALASYGTFDAAPHGGDNLYRIRVEGEDGKVTYSEVAKVRVGEDGSTRTLIALYPNPVSRREGKAVLMLTNVKEGDYLVSVYSGSGQSVLEKKVTVGSGSSAQTQTLTLPPSLAQGSYQVKLTDNKGATLFIHQLIIEK